MAAISSTRLRRDAIGLGLRPSLYPALLGQEQPVDFLEIITENFLGPAPLPRRNLARIRARYPVVLHGVSLNLLGPEPIDEVYLEQVRRLADEVDAAYVTDHLCWTGGHGVSHHDLLPVPYVPELVELAAERAAWVQKRLDRPFGLENLSSYVQFRRSKLSEWKFYTSVVESAGCWFLLDLNNIQVSSLNHGFDPREYLRAIDFSRVLQVHLAGHTRLPEGGAVDTHDQAVCDEVWSLYQEAWALGGPFPTLLEWDDRIPPFEEVRRELGKVREYQG
ncbi:MAG: DUF692 domain-containing protein [Myxococcales bacterium]|nr:DUF692 domain-containing protein [Polyangiaceae bacterium]MDW8248614.1 DUF692 domain-containing protein [Myxococcales bacterium]